MRGAKVRPRRLSLIRSANVNNTASLESEKAKPVGVKIQNLPVNVASHLLGIYKTVKAEPTDPGVNPNIPVLLHWRMPETSSTHTCCKNTADYVQVKCVCICVCQGGYVIDI